MAPVDREHLIADEVDLEELLQGDDWPVFPLGDPAEYDFDPV